MTRLARAAALLITLVLALGTSPRLAFAQSTGDQGCAAGFTVPGLVQIALLRAALGPTVGEPLECVHGNVETGDLLQQTSAGLLVYRTLTDTAFFTDGYVHWTVTADGLARWLGSGLDPPRVTIVSASGAPVGGPVSVSVLTSPNATCTLDYVTPSGSASRATGLGQRVADADGQVGWSWRIGPSTRPGVGQVTVTCDGATAQEVLPVD